MTFGSKRNMTDHCDQCGTSWEVPDSVQWEDDKWDPNGDMPIEQLEILRDEYSASGYDAKSIALHIPWTGGSCHNCSTRIPRGWVRCSECGATNYNFHGPPNAAQRIRAIPNPLLKTHQAEQAADAKPDNVVS